MPLAADLLGCRPAPGETLPLERLFAEQDLGLVRRAAAAVLHQGRPSEALEVALHRLRQRSIRCRCAIQPLVSGETAPHRPDFYVRPPHGGREGA
jgi:hypothetical protein